MPLLTPRAPGRYRLVGAPDEVLTAVLELHQRGQLGEYAWPVTRAGRTSLTLRVRRDERTRRRIRLAVLAGVVLVLLVALIWGGIAAANWAARHGAPLLGVSMVVRGLWWLYRRQDGAS